MGSEKVKRPVPPYLTPKPTLHIAKALLFALEYAEIPGFVGLEEGEREEKKKTCIALQGKLVRPKLEFLCVGGCEQWQLSVRQQLQRSAE